MNHRDRLEQLRGLLDRLERLPASPDRDWLLGEVRVRTVDVETGAQPAPMRTQHPDETAYELAAASTTKTTRAKARRSVAERHVERPVPAMAVPSTPPREPAPQTGRESGLDLLEQGDLLSLDEPSTGATGSDRPWRRGLRG